MKRRLLSLFLAIGMVLGMLPVTAQAATAVPVTDNVIDITDININSSMVIINTLTISGATVVSAEETDTGLNVVLQDDTDPAATITVTPNCTVNVQAAPVLGNTCTLADGTGSHMVSVAAIYSNRPYGSASLTITYTVEESSCTHESTTIAYAQVEGTETHTVTETCDACGRQVSQTTEACVDTDSNYVCDLCEGAATSGCGHTNTTTTKVQNTDEETHTITVTCDDCTTQLSQTTEDCVDEDENNVCDVCEGTLVDPLEGAKSITVPSGAEVTVYYQSAYYKATEVEPVKTVENANGTTTYYYQCTESTTYQKGYVYRAKLGSGILKAGYLHSVDSVTLSWDGSASPSYQGGTNVPNYTANGSNIYRSGDGVRMNLNSTGHLVLSSGGTKELGAYRVWEIIDSDTTNVQIQPDFHFTRVAGDDIYSLTEIAAAVHSNNWQKLTATGSGTAFMEVSYDAVHVVNGYTAGAWGGAYGHLDNYIYNASKQNGLVVIQTDGNAASDVTFNIASDRDQVTWTWDAERDTYYFLDSDATLTLAPTATSGIGSVWVSTNKGASFTQLTAGEDASYTANIVEGNNIFKVVNGSGQTAYQVVRCAKLGVNVVNLTDSGAELADPGDSVRLVFDGLIAPVYKMSGIYNPAKNQVKYTGTNSASYATNGTSYYVGVPYSYNGNDYYYTSIDVTIPTDKTSLEDDGYVLSSGYMSYGGYAGAGTEHRSMLSYNGVAQNTTASMVSNVKNSVMPDIIIPVAVTNNLPYVTDEDGTIEIEMRLNDWYELDLSDYFADDDGDELTYYVYNEGTDTWTALSDSTYLYYPAGDGEQAAAFIALDGSMALEDAMQDENVALLVLEADVEEAPEEVTVTYNVTQGTDKFYTSDQNVILSSREITVPYFDLSLYGLEDYYYNPRCYSSWNGTSGSGTAGTVDSAEGVVTTMHVFIWATEVYQLGYDEADAGTGKSYNADSDTIANGLISCSGGAGSSFMNLWNGTNMNYYLNMEYPLGYPKIGSTCDQQALYDGDVISVHMIEDTIVMGSSFSALVLDEDSSYDYASDAVEAAVTKGEKVTLTAYGSVSDWTNYVTSYEPNSGATVVYSTTFTADTSTWTQLGTTDDNGQIEIDTSDLSAGTYYIAVQGDVDTEASKESEIALFTLTVEAGTEPEVLLGDVDGDGTVTMADMQMIYNACGGLVTLTEAQIQAADVDGNGSVEMDDMQLVYQFVGGIISGFPAEE